MPGDAAPNIDHSKLAGAMARILRGGAQAVGNFFAPQADSLGAMGVAKIRSLLPGGGTYEQELGRYNAEAAPSPILSPDSRFGSVVYAPDDRFKGGFDPEGAGFRRAEAMAMQAPMAGALVAHSSPHVFKRPDISRIGTGEGNQSFGWGLYSSSNPPMTDAHYRRRLLGYAPVVYGDAPIVDRLAALRGPYPSEEVAKQARFKESDRVLWQHLSNETGTPGGQARVGADPQGVLEAVVARLRRYRDEARAQVREQTSYEGFSDGVERLREMPPEARRDSVFGVLLDGVRRNAREAAAYGIAARKAKKLSPEQLKMGDSPTGSFHIWDIPDEMMHFDRPMSEQQHILDRVPHGLRARLEDTLEAHNQPYLEELSGSQFYQLLKREASEGGLPMQGDTLNNARDASEFLHSIGVPGHSYVGNSGIRNFVTYSDQSISPMGTWRSLADAEADPRGAELLARLLREHGK